MDETATRQKKINPKLYEVGWEQVPESEILEEQRAYITPDRWALVRYRIERAEEKVTSRVCPHGYCAQRARNLVASPFFKRLTL
jgi:hypothetical protein